MKGNLKRTMGLVRLKLKKHSPEILVGIGAIGSVGAVVVACKATTHLEETLDICKARKNELEEFPAETPDEIKAYRKENFKVTVQNTWDIVKLYAPAAGLELLSLSVIFAANDIQRKRNASLAAAYATLDSMFKSYRKNVIEAYGEDIDKDMRYGVKHEKVEVVESDPETGKDKKVKKQVDFVDPNDPSYISDYARFYDSSVTGWDECAEYNMMKLKSCQQYANNLLQSRGYLFLNEVYKMIGLPESIAGQSVGWILDPNNDNGDGYVDFGIYKFTRANQRFVNGLEPVILLDFNVDGDLLNNEKLNKLLNKKISR